MTSKESRSSHKTDWGVKDGSFSPQKQQHIQKKWLRGPSTTAESTASGESGGRPAAQTSAFLLTTLGCERLMQTGGVVVEEGESEGKGKHYAILECYFYFKSHHV